VGAALRDLLQVFQRRSPSVSLLLAPCQVQGRGAAAEIIRAIQSLNEQEDVDLIILGRGGGSIEDLWAFNEEAVARAIAASRLPILTGIGHETDYTIADFVADKRAPTPSAAAEIAAPADKALRDALEEKRYRMLQAISSRIDKARLRLERMARRLPSPEQQARQLHLRLADAQQRMERALFARINRWKRQLAVLQSRLDAQDPGLALQQQQQTLRLLQQRLSHAMQRTLDQQRHRIGLIAQRLHDLSPLQILDRGYALVSDTNGSVVRDAHTLQKGQLVTLRLQQGQATAQILSIQPNTPILSASSTADPPSAFRKRPSRPTTQSQLPLPIFPHKEEK
jgi:exodeoxyribonuclease VII large subunit